MAYNRSHKRYNRHDRFVNVRKRRQLLAFLDVQRARLTATGKTFTVLNQSGGIAANGLLTSTGTAPANNDTVTIAAKVYTFQTVLTNVDGNVLIGASATAALANLVSAITLGAGSGTTYAAATTANPAGTTATSGASTLTLTATTKGAIGNAIATTKSSAQLSWGAPSLINGATNNGAAFTATAHGFRNLEGPFVVSNSGGALPPGLTATPKEYWVIVSDVNTIQLGVAKANLVIDAVGLDVLDLVAVTGNGTGTQTIKRDIATRAGVFELLRTNKPERILSVTSTDALA